MIVELTADNIDPTIEDNEIVFVYFWAPETPSWQELKEIVAAAADRHPDVTFAFCDAVEETGIAKMFQLKAVPSITVFRQQTVVFAQSTALPAANIDDLLGRVRALDMAEVKSRIKDQPSASTE